MLVACWSVKGGSGTTVVAAALGVLLARSTPAGALVVDMGDDLASALGVPEAGGPGLADWAAHPDLGADALCRLEAPVAPGLALLRRGTATLDAAGAERLVATLTGERHVVVDCGSGATPAALAVAGAAPLSLLVLRPCYLALRRALAVPLRASGVVLVSEPGRALGRRDVEEVLGLPVRAEVAWDPAVARAVDAGLVAARVPRSLERALRRAA